MTNIVGREFSTQTMSGRKYVNEYPDLLQAVVDSSSFEAGHSDAIPLPSKLYLQHGELELQASPNKRFYPGMIVTLSGDNNDTEGYAFVVRYSPADGQLVLSIQGWSSSTIYGPLLRITVSVNGGIIAANGPVSNFKGGTGTGVLSEIYEQFDYKVPETFSEEIADDFVGYINPAYPSPYGIDYQSGSGNCYSYPKPGQVSSFSPENKAGFIALEASQTLDSIVLKRGVSHRNLLSGITSIGTATHYFLFNIPVLSAIGEGFIIKIGLTSADSSPATPGNAGGIVLSYTHTVNSGRFTLLKGVSGSVTYENTSIVATAGWHSLVIIGRGDTASVQIDGNTVALTPPIYDTGDAAVFCPVMSITKNSGTSPRLLIVDLYFSSQSVVR